MFKGLRRISLLGRSRIAHHIDFPDYADDELLAEPMLRDINYGFAQGSAPSSFATSQEPAAVLQRAIRNAPDRPRLRQASRLVADLDHVLTANDVSTIEASDVLAACSGRAENPPQRLSVYFSGVR